MSKSPDPTLHIIPLATEFLHAPYISDTLLRALEQVKQEGKKSLLLYNRRGTARAYICEDCGFYEKCPHCDVAYAYHQIKGGSLLCHQCGSRAPVPLNCQYCGGNRFHMVGTGIQQIETDVATVLPTARILRIDGDSDTSTKKLIEKIQDTDIIISTSRGIFVPNEDIALVAFLFFEVNFSLPEYTLEETLGAEMLYYKKQKIPLYIQTYMPDHPLLQEIVFGNTRSIMNYIKNERRDFHYPPYVGLYILFIHNESKQKVLEFALNILEKIARNFPDIQISYDENMWSKYRSEWTQKIFMRGPGVTNILPFLEKDVLRNRSITLMKG